MTGSSEQFNSTQDWLNGEYPVSAMKDVDVQIRIAKALEYIAYHTKRTADKLDKIDNYIMRQEREKEKAINAMFRQPR